MATKKTEISKLADQIDKELGSKRQTVDTVEELVNAAHESMIMYEEEMTTIKVAGQPRSRILQKIPYLEFGGHKVYLSKDEVTAIKKGKLDPQKLLDDIPVQEVYRNE